MNDPHDNQGNRLTPDWQPKDEIKATRKDWKLTTWADGFGRWSCKVESPAGWGNAGVRDIDKHISAMKARARRAIIREINERQGAPVTRLRLLISRTNQDPQGIFRSITFTEIGAWS